MTTPTPKPTPTPPTPSRVSDYYRALAVSRNLPVPLSDLGPAFTSPAMIAAITKEHTLRRIDGELWIELPELERFLVSVRAGPSIGPDR